MHEVASMPVTNFPGTHCSQTYVSFGPILMLPLPHEEHLVLPGCELRPDVHVLHAKTRPESAEAVSFAHFLQTVVPS